jgi:hypothetical protein
MICATCPVGAGACLGESVPRLCFLARTRADYRLQLVRTALESAPAASGAAIDLSSALGAVSACPHRGPVLPVSLQPECGCSELSECRAGRGLVPGRVTLLDCLACVLRRSAERPGESPLSPPP